VVHADGLLAGLVQVSTWFITWCCGYRSATGASPIAYFCLNLRYRSQRGDRRRSSAKLVVSTTSSLRRVVRPRRLLLS